MVPSRAQAEVPLAKPQTRSPREGDPVSPPAVARDDRDRLCGTELQDAWPVLSRADRAEGFSLLPRGEAEDLFLALSSREQYHLLLALPLEDRRSWIRMLPPDDTAD